MKQVKERIQEKGKKFLKGVEFNKSSSRTEAHIYIYSIGKKWEICACTSPYDIVERHLEECCWIYMVLRRQSNNSLTPKQIKRPCYNQENTRIYYIAWRCNEVEVTCLCVNI